MKCPRPTSARGGSYYNAAMEIRLSPRFKSWLVFAVKILIALLVVGWIGFELHRSWGTIVKHQWRPQIGWLVVAAVCYLAAWIPAAFYWLSLLKLWGQTVPLSRAMRAYMIGHLGKYTPGKAMVVVLRAAMVKSETSRASVAAAAVFYETFMMMATGSLLSTFIIFFAFANEPQWLGLLACSLAMVAINGGVTIPAFFRYAVLRLGVGRDDEAVQRGLNSLGLKTMLVGAASMSVVWVVLGISLWATICGMGIHVGSLAETLPRFTAAMALSMVTGFVAMMPGGLGVREWVLAQLLTLYFAGMTDDQRGGLAPETIGIIIAAVQRVISILAEIALASVIEGVYRWRGGR
ncbi:MAG: lysylphosphatidylglycerol synthase transmembrane domain-containing protein [Thermoguttaceae bacterium]